MNSFIVNDGDNMRIIYLDMPLSVHEAVTIDADGDYVIALNARDNYYTRRKYYQHALNHIKRRDFEKFDVDTIENLCHQCDDCRKKA